YRKWVRRVGELWFMRVGVFLMAIGLAGAVVVLFARGGVGPGGGGLGGGVSGLWGCVGGFSVGVAFGELVGAGGNGVGRQGEVLGVNQSASALARILGPFLGVTLFFVSPTHVVPYALGCLLLLFVFGLTARIQRD